jgi:hypothetical protein
METLKIDNFGGRLTRYNDGDINSGFAKWATTYSNDPFAKPGNLTWMETATQIDPTGSIISDLIMAGKERVESGISYVYAVGHTGRVYKIQVNDPSSYNPNYDNPVLLTTLVSGSPTFTRGASIDFFGSTERLYIGHDKGLTRLDFAGTNETVVGLLASWTQSVPRPTKQFVGKMYIGNGSNVAEMDSTGTITTYTRLAPGFPDNTQVRDLDLSVDGNYLHFIVSRLALPDLTATTQDTTFLSNSESYIFKWNGTDTGYTSFDVFPSFSLNSNVIFGRNQYVFGYDLSGAAVFNPTEKILSPVLSQAPTPNAVGSNGNLVGWGTPEYYNGFTRFANYIYGSLDSEVTLGWWRQFAQSAQGTETDVIRCPFELVVSNFGIGSSSNGYAGSVFGSGKLYFSTLETSASPTTKYKFYKLNLVSSPFGNFSGGVYETQNEILKEKVKISEVRVYAAPWVANNAFTIDIIGSANSSISSKSFATGTNITVGQDFAKYTPQVAPTYTIGLRVSNTGSTNWTCNKVEIDYDKAGK